MKNIMDEILTERRIKELEARLAEAIDDLSMVEEITALQKERLEACERNLSASRARPIEDQMREQSKEISRLKAKLAEYENAPIVGCRSVTIKNGQAGKDKAYWLADKIPAYGDYAKEAAGVLRAQADEIERIQSMRYGLEDQLKAAQAANATLMAQNVTLTCDNRMLNEEVTRLQGHDKSTKQ